ncbi:S49 family peptidase [Pararhizobium mangrovi]|uniref:S49 family peptidase n=1 Tax=Pararhizobium mangrovi TaxID=2590452 RepID=A0A506U2U7_9HYPH|nr:S49 family peptidase [Pararhizobium mangrovi]TPW28130.1 S49 family peptidase [Pararhizobium mangrovi]
MASLKSLLPRRFRKEGVAIPVVRLHGAIMAGGSQFRQNLNLAAVAPLLNRAFADKHAPAVAISVNSPGGSPVQSRLIFARIRDLAKEKNKRVLMFVEDVAASGGYMIAIAGDEIFVDPSSIVGSIGVVSAGFGFQDLIEKIGVERRVHTAGRNKAVLDPFRPERQEDVDHLLRLQGDIHAIFIDMVKERRGAKLVDDDELFTGLFWTGAKGRDLGLVDGFGDMRTVLKERYGENVELKLVARKRSLLRRPTPGVFAGGLNGAEIASGAVDGLAGYAEERLLWARYGL